MYIPEHFHIENRATILAFMRSNPFAILVSSDQENIPFATHVPVIVKEEIRDHENQLLIRGHVAKANPHWRYLESQPNCLMIFHGPHAYVSASNYNTPENVPTWNYAAVHAYGQARVFSSPEDLQGVLHELIPMFEPAFAEQWSGLKETYRQHMLSNIVGFEIAVTKLEAKFKLSQNRLKDEQEKVMVSLGSSNDTTVAGVAQLMQERKLARKK